MQSSTRLVVFVCLTLTFFSCDQALAQMFGNRGGTPGPNNNGQPNNPSAGAGTTISGGPNSLGIGRPAQGMERFLRQNRSARDFVGRNRTEISSFVGAQQALAVGQVRSATEGLRIDNSNAKRVNRPIPPQPAKGLYYPKLVLDDGEAEPDIENTNVSRDVDAKLLTRLQRIGGSNLQVNLSGATATLTGQVDSKRTAELVEQLLSFEPGIETVVNRLSIAQRVP